jgi:hypothetical protein
MKNMTVTVTGANIATGAASVSIPIPPASSGEIPRHIRVSSTAAAYFKIGTASVVAVAGDTMVQPGDAVRIVVPRGVTHIAAIQQAIVGTLNVVPLEDC